MNALARPLPASSSAEILWERMLDCLRQDKLEYALGWIGRMRPLEVREDTLVMGVPDRFYRDWLDDHYRPLLESTLARVADRPMELAYEVVPGPPRRPTSSPHRPRRSPRAPGPRA
ncbi:DnaA N-terminal domain-containing protein [Cystobacter fuscus]